MVGAAQRVRRSATAHAGEIARLLAAAAVVIGGSVGASHNVEDVHRLDAFAFVLLGLLAGTLLLRGSPLVMVAVSAPLLGSYLGAGYPHGPSFLPLVVALVGVGLRHDRRIAWRAAGGAAVVVLAGTAMATIRGFPSSGWGTSARVVVVIIVCGVPTLVGTLLRSSRNAAARAKEEATLRRIEQERLRLAREVHDVVGHSLSVISLRAAVALHVLDRRPEQAQLALEAIRRTSVDALDELRATLALGRAGHPPPGSTDPSAPGPAPAGPAATSPDGGPDVPPTVDVPPAGMGAPAAPLTGLRRLPSLVDEVRLCGVPVEVQMVGAPEQRDRLPLAVDLAAFRIVQESLTNVLRHTPRGATRVEVTVTITDDQLTLDITDHPRGPGAQGPSSATGAGPSLVGHGLTGLRERAAELGGTLTAGFTDIESTDTESAGGGWRVHAVLPAGGHATPPATPQTTAAPAAGARRGPR
ncbi:histidine kinase [Frankia sp. R82]|uniref:sensor histidine kinase n=1 Tax=Frankia sp. R82 TaxID=2950553 RepID=UPI002042E88D|nr:histidine kinase [Frankia sp. R82]MCM3886239.1 histidine kinase [Frankia sp. R82]